MCDAFQANQVPPRPAPLLEQGARKPDIRELKQVRDLQHFARCVEHMYFRGNCEDQMHHPWGDDHRVPPEEQIRMRSRFHCAMYRVLFVGAALTREYLEPLFLGTVHGPLGFLSRIMALGQEEAHGELARLTQEDITYLERFPVYDLEAGQEKWEPVFGDLASWLLGDIESTFTDVPPPRLPARGMDAKELGRLQEVTFFLAAHAHIVDKLFNKYDIYPGSDSRTPPPFPGRIRKVSVAILGIFHPEEVLMPEMVEDSSSCYLINELLVPKEQPTPWTTEIQSVLDVLHFQSGGLTLRNGFPSPPPALRFIDFILVKFFKTRFKDDLFYDESPRYHLEQYRFGFLQEPDLFRDWSIRTTTWLFA